MVTMCELKQRSWKFAANLKLHYKYNHWLPCSEVSTILNQFLRN